MGTAKEQFARKVTPGSRTIKKTEEHAATQLQTASHPSHRKTEHGKPENEKENKNFRSCQTDGPRDATECLVRTDVFEKLYPKEDAVDADEVLLEIDLKRDVLKLRRRQILNIAQHVALNFECGGDAQIEYCEEEDEIRNVHCVPKVFEVLSRPSVKNLLRLLYDVVKHLSRRHKRGVPCNSNEACHRAP